MQLHVIAGMTPIPFTVQVAQVEAVLESQFDSGQSPGDFAGDKGFPPYGRLMIEEDAVTGEQVVGLPVIDGDPVGVEFGNRVLDSYLFTLRVYTSSL